MRRRSSLPFCSGRGSGGCGACCWGFRSWESSKSFPNTSRGFGRWPNCSVNKGRMQSNGTRCTPSQSPLPRFDRAAKRCEQLMGNSLAFALAVLLLLAWLIAGPFFGFSDTWQLVINTATTIVTFLMVFLIQNTQNRDTKAVHLKLDEIIRALEGARNALLEIENLSDDQLKELEEQFQRLRKKAEQAGLRPGKVKSR